MRKTKRKYYFFVEDLVALIYLCPAKRQLLSFINPFVFRLKGLFQMECREKLDWNDILSKECLK